MFQNNYTYDVCHEHLYDFGLINMNGRVYDPLTSSFLSPDIYVQDPTTQQGFNRYAYCMYNPLKYVDPSGYRYFGYDEAAYYRMLEEIAKQVFHEWYSIWELAAENVQLTINMACGLFGHGLDTHANGSGHHGAAGGGIQVHDKGNGTFTVVGGSVGPDHSITVIDGDHAGTVIGYYLTDYSFADKYGNIVTGVTIDLNDSSGQDFWDAFISNPPSLYDYVFDEEHGGQNGGDYDFKTKGHNSIYDGMPIDFGFGCYITTARDIGNFTAGYMAGSNGIPYNYARAAFDAYQFMHDFHFEPSVSRLAQNMGYWWGFSNFSIKILNSLRP